MTTRNLLSATACFTLLTSLLVGCQVQVPSDDNTQSSNKDGSPPVANDNNAGTKKSPSKNTDPPSTDGDDDSDPSTPDDDNNTTPSADTTAVSNMHWSTPNGVAGSIFYDVELSSDGTYRKQQIIFSSSGSLLHCEYGSWKASEAAAGKLELVSTCTGETYEQTWRQSADGDLVLQGVEYTKDPTGVWNCAATECK